MVTIVLYSKPRATRSGFLYVALPLNWVWERALTRWLGRVGVRILLHEH